MTCAARRPERNRGVGSACGPELGGFMGMWFVAVRAACCLAVLSPAAYASAATAQTTPADAKMAAAQTLAEVLVGGTSVEKQVDAVLASMTKHAFSSDPTLQALKAEYPGVDRVFVDVLRPILIEELQKALPEYTAAHATFFATNFTTAEIGELTRFWRSPTGQALVASVSGALDYDGVSKELAGQISDGNDMSVAGGTVDADKRRAATAGYGQMTGAQKVEIVRFGLTPVGRKMARLQAQKNEIDHKWANREPSPEAAARIEREMGQAILAFIDAEDKKRAAAN